MANTVSVLTLQQTEKHLVVKLLGLHDGASGEEAAVVKVDKSTFLAPGRPGATPAEPSKLTIKAIAWDVQTFKAVTLLFDHTADDVVARLAGQNFLDYTLDGRFQGIADPASAGATGDILLTTIGTAANATYDITLWLEKVQ